MANFLKRWFEGIPTGTTSGTTEKTSQDFKIALRERLALEHYPFNNGIQDATSATAGGRHIPGAIQLVRAATWSNIQTYAATAVAGSIFYDTDNQRLVVIKTAGQYSDAYIVPVSVYGATFSTLTAHTAGQIWYDSTKQVLWVDNGTNFTSIYFPLTQISASTPSVTATNGMLWWDTTNSVLKVYNSGWKICFPVMKLAFSAIASATQTIAYANFGSQIQVTFGTASLNDGSKFASSRWTPGKLGICQLNASVMVSASKLPNPSSEIGALLNGIAMFVYIAKNGSPICHSSTYGMYGNPYNNTCNLSIIAEVTNTADYFSVLVKFTSNITADYATLVGDYRSQFSGAMLSVGMTEE